MIAQLTGRLVEKRPDRVLLDVHGVGYEVHISLSTFDRLDGVESTVQLRVYTHVKEDALLLYGFLTQREKEVFEHLISVSGIGPRLAMTLLSGLDCDEVVRSIQQGDVARLTSIPGIGRKTAERLIVELKDRLGRLATAGPPAGTPAQAAQEDAVSALINLGYARNVAEKAVAAALRDAGSDSSVQKLLKAALRRLVSG